MDRLSSRSPQTITIQNHLKLLNNEKNSFFLILNISFSINAQWSYPGANWAMEAQNSTATGDYAVAMGNNTTASGNSSVAMGENSVASGLYSLSFGVQTNASGYAAIAMGRASTASGESATSIGHQTTALVPKFTC